MNWKTRNGSPFYNGVFNTSANFNKIFSDLLDGAGVEISYGKFPAVNVSESDEKFLLECVVPGFEKEELKISLEENQLIINGEKKSEALKENSHYTKREFKAEKFSRSFNLPENVNADSIDAEYKNGILFVTLPKISTDKRTNKEININ